MIAGVMVSGCWALARWAASGTTRQPAVLDAVGDRLEVRGGVAGSSAPAIGERGRGDRRQVGAQVHGRDGLAAPGVPLGRGGGDDRLAGGPDVGVRPPRYAGVNQRATTASATAPVPPARTVAARSVQALGGPAGRPCTARPAGRRGRGRGRASRMPVIPPSERPTKCARSTPSRSSSATTSSARSSMRTGRRAPASRRGRGCRSGPPGSAAASSCGLGVPHARPWSRASWRAPRRGACPVTTAWTSTALTRRARRPRRGPGRRRCTSSRVRSGRRGGASRERAWPGSARRWRRPGGRARCRSRWR